jgi:hypothetical protein
MIKISANVSKKTPLPGVEYSSQQFGAAMEIEVSDADNVTAIQTRIRDLYMLLSKSIDEQIAAAQPQAPVAQNRLPQQPYRNNGGNGNGGNGHNGTQQRAGYATSHKQNGNGNGSNNGNGRKTTATVAQCKAIYAISKSLNLDLAAVLADYNVSDASQLHIKVASQLIDDLKSRQNGAPAQQ